MYSRKLFLGKKMKKIMWFSRHEMSAEQKEALVKKLGEIEITQINGTAPNVHVSFKGEINGVSQEISPIKELVKEFDIIAIVAPIGLQQQFLAIAGDKPVIMAENARTFEGDNKVTFKFVRWFQVHKIEVVTSDFAS